jgi:hypothetical protein
MKLNLFVPRYRYISNITNSTNAVITFTQNNHYTLGQIVSFRVTPSFGMPEINNLSAKVIAITSNSITVPIDTSTWGIFTLALLNTPGTTPPTVVPAGSGVKPYSAIPMTNIQDCFDNILI